MKRLLCLFALALVASGDNILNHYASVTVSVTNASYTAVTSPLNRATFIQVYIQPTSTEQVFSIRSPNCSASSCTTVVPSKGIFTIDGAASFLTTDALFSVQTASSAATLQVVAMRTR